jgi:hypothetical protein
MKKMSSYFSVVALITIVLIWSTSAGAAPPTLLSGDQSFDAIISTTSTTSGVGTTFTYQGYLTDGNSPANGVYDFTFTLHDDLTAGSQVGSTITIDNKQITGGLLTTELNFGDLFEGRSLYLQIGLRAGNSTGSYTQLLPRQKLTDAPYSQTRVIGRITPPAENQQSTLEHANSVGSHNSVTIGSDGLPLISYYDFDAGDLLVTHCNDLVCSNATTTKIDGDDYVGTYNSITIGTDGMGLISYFDSTNKNLKVAHCENVICSSASTYTLDNSIYVGESSSITIGADGLGLISYYDRDQTNLKVAHCDNVQCSSATTYTRDSSSGDVGFFTSITLGTDGLGLISYYKATGGQLRVAHCNNDLCSSASVNIVDDNGNVGHETSITIGADGLGLISYYDWDQSALKVAHCINQSCSSSNVYLLDNSGSVGNYSSITIGSDGLGIISYRDGSTPGLKFAHCTTTFCYAASFYNIAIDGTFGGHSSITLGADGLPFISLSESGQGNLSTLHCANPFCVPNFRLR